jgi:ADP-ribose pyrophosphatase YjhB (NUDIX family)
MVRVETLGIVYRGDKVLLGLKKKRDNKTGFGVGKWNGYGGGMEDVDNDSLEACLIREAFDEAKIRLKNLKKIGFMHYSFDNPEQDHEVHIYTTDSFDGELDDTDEMYMHSWFGVDEIPYDKEKGKNGCGMWDNDKFWMPYFLRGEEFKGRVFMDSGFHATSCVINGKEWIR